MNIIKKKINGKPIRFSKRKTFGAHLTVVTYVTGCDDGCIKKKYFNNDYCLQKIVKHFKSLVRIMNKYHKLTVYQLSTKIMY